MSIIIENLPFTIDHYHGITAHPIQPPLAKQPPLPTDLPGALLPGDRGTGRAAGDHRAEGHPPFREEQPAQAGGERTAAAGHPPGEHPLHEPGGLPPGRGKIAGHARPDLPNLSPDAYPAGKGLPALRRDPGDPRLREVAAHPLRAGRAAQVHDHRLLLLALLPGAGHPADRAAGVAGDLSVLLPGVP